MNKRIAVVGAGLSGAVVGHRLAGLGYLVDVFEQRDHVGGNCHTRRDADTGVMVHTYGPHIFHTDNRRVWEFVNQFDRFYPYVHRVLANTRGCVYFLPINLLTINQFFDVKCSPAQARALLESKADRTIVEPRTFEEQALRFVGRELYEAFFAGYTRKQWGRDPSELPASVLQRLPVRFTYDVGYYNDPYQGVPVSGYTKVVAKMLEKKGIRLYLNRVFERELCADYHHVFFSGPLDGFFQHALGRLEYRTLAFEAFTTQGDFQGCAVMNYCSSDFPYTRITEHKHFSPWESHGRTVCFREFSHPCGVDDVPYYPIPMATQNSLLKGYEELAKEEQKVTFIGRLGTYRYLDMDDAVREALEATDRFLAVR